LAESRQEIAPAVPAGHGGCGAVAFGGECAAAANCLVIVERFEKAIRRNTFIHTLPVGRSRLRF